MTIAYFDCQVGVSGDMILGALVDAGAPLPLMQDALAGLPDEFQVRLKKEEVTRGGIRASHVQVEGNLTPAHGRSFADLLRLVDHVATTSENKEQARRILQSIGEAEARVHRVSLEDVHLHELGSLDTLVDVLGAVIGLSELGITKVYSAPLPAGHGTVRSEHGKLPVPVPAVLELAKLYAVPLRTPTSATVAGELVTPTGAAILATLASFEPVSIVPDRVGHGAGTRDPESYPNVLTLWVGESRIEDVDQLILIETNIDDMNPEIYSYVRERLTSAGARDVWMTAIQMKKDRPGVAVSILAEPSDEKQMLEILFHETSTLGARIQQIRRPRVDREIVRVTTTLGESRVKIKRADGRVISVAPEYDDCRQLALDSGLSLQDVYRVVRRAAEDKWLS
ncbi:MAG: nickel pincer cofactor biosynthesis protein LarC [SAR202 cluster bacterium]|nr:nickel pincer cofactor biosynthesis protein LarC [SAR202 cluster bacterium]|tara:strand:- start:271 stop:1458 length:1188 start_codon:yes stop_codon:yes gene_type:complete